MKLGIVVVYLVSPENEKLLDLHLMQIEKYTQVPYTIYASVNRLLPECRRKLEQQPKIRICDCPTTDLRGWEEHAYYLEHLTRFAIEDGVSHVVTMHVDSFPIRRRWVEDLAEKITHSCAFVTILPCYTACLFFHRDFYLKYHPKFTLSEKDKASWQWAQYQLKFAPFLHSGVGYGFRAYSEGLSWHYLEKTHDLPYYGGIYNDMVFHLSGAARVLTTNSKTMRFFAGPGYFQIGEKMSWLARMTIPVRVRAGLRKIFTSQIEHSLDRPRALHEKETMYDQTKQLLIDPEAYLNRLTNA